MSRCILFVLLGLIAPALLVPAAAPAVAQEAWHPVREQWQPYPEGDLSLPAEQYCGDFDVHSTVRYQDVSSRVLSRWASGGPRITVYSGPLQVRHTNQTTGRHVDLDLSGYARTLQRPDGSLARYRALGPVGFGWPKGSVGLPQGYYVFDGDHTVRFPVDGPRRLVRDEGTEVNVCDRLR